MPPPEIACDESGSEGEKLLGGTTDVFAHAALDLDRATAAACIDEVRVGTRSPATECKASVVLRERNRRVLVWLLGPDGPLLGHGHVHLTEKAYHLVHRLTGGETVTARLLHEHGTATLGPAWRDLLLAHNDLARDRGDGDLVAALTRHLVERHAGTPAGLALATLQPVTDVDPILGALSANVAHWPGPVRVVHDEQRALTPARVRALLSGSGVVSIRFVDSMDDPRVQVADLLAGAARRIAADALHGHADLELCTLLAPYVDRGSCWGDPVSGALLQPAASRSRANSAASVAGV